jgi:hypothetical protein
VLCLAQALGIEAVIDVTDGIRSMASWTGHSVHVASHNVFKAL